MQRNLDRRQVRFSDTPALQSRLESDEIQPPRENAPVEDLGWRAHTRELALSFLSVVLALFLLFTALFAKSASDVREAEIDQAVARALASVTPAPPAAVGVYQAIRPSLVEVSAALQDPTGAKGMSYGTGFIIDDRGTVMTSLHVVSGSAAIQLLFVDGTVSPAKLAKAEPQHDIAFLRPRVVPKDLTPALLGNPNQLQIGDQAIVVGNPMRLPGTLTTGSISGLNRDFQPPDGSAPMRGMIQIDAAVNPGSSGGPLLNRRGEVVGIITGRASPNGESAFIGIGFAVPIDTAISSGSPPAY